MAIDSIGTGSALPYSVLQLKSQFSDLQQQLATGKRGQTHGEMGQTAALGLALRGQIAETATFQASIKLAQIRLDALDDVLGRTQEIVDTTRSALGITGLKIDSQGRASTQYQAENAVTELVSLYNSRIDGRHLLAGRAADSPPVESAEAILDGAEGKAGLRQVIAERNLADLGADGLGRLVIPAAAGADVSVTEDAASPFGFKLAAVNSGLSGTTVTGPAGSPAGLTVSFSAALPVPGEEIAISLDLPDGTTTEIRLTATTADPPGDGAFTIGADETATAANFQAALTDAVADLASTELTAASAVQAANEFFDFDAANPPKRVAGPPFETATALVDATAADTVFWYKGDLSDGPARASVTARIDDSVTIDYGVRADEAALRDALKEMALLSVQRFDTDPAAFDTEKARYQALTSRMVPVLGAYDGRPSVREIAQELAHKHESINAAARRHDETLAFAKSSLEESEGVDLEEVAAKILRLQTQLQASYETTRLLARLSLVNFLD